MDSTLLLTYDWSLTTDISRVNAAKICGKLGVEHIIRSADIEKKRVCEFKSIFLVKDLTWECYQSYKQGTRDFMTMVKTI